MGHTVGIEPFVIVGIPLQVNRGIEEENSADEEKTDAGKDKCAGESGYH